jgi:chromosome segregation ATPase
MDTIEARLAAALEGVAAKDAEVAEARATAESVVALNLELTEKLKQAEDKLAAIEAEKAALAAKVEAAAENAVSASEEAAKIAASVGVAPVETNPAADAAPKADILEQYMSLSGLERSAFFAANKNAIMAVLRK